MGEMGPFWHRTSGGIWQGPEPCTPISPLVPSTNSTEPTPSTSQDEQGSIWAALSFLVFGILIHIFTPFLYSAFLYMWEVKENRWGMCYLWWDTKLRGMFEAINIRNRQPTETAGSGDVEAGRAAPVATNGTGATQAGATTDPGTSTVAPLPPPPGGGGRCDRSEPVGEVLFAVPSD